MTTEIQNNPERGLRQENVKVTPKFLYEDNHSSQAQINREKNEDARMHGKRKAWRKCSDARGLVAGVDAILWGSIAGADEADTKFATDRGTEASIALSHYDGDTLIPGEMPSGCGGLNAKKEIGNEKHKEGIKKFVSEKIKIHDPLIHTLFLAEDMAIWGHKPTLAATQDHLTLQIYPVALYLPQENGEIVIRSRIRSQDTMATSYNPKRLYENGIPTISESSLPDCFIKVLEQNVRDVQEFNSRYPDLRKMQKVQNPRTILLSTDVRPLSTKYPTLASIPGSVFQVIVPRGKIEGSPYINEEDLQNSLDQLEYPISEAIKHHGSAGKAFADTDNIVIETGNLDLSKKVAQKAIMERDWIREWLKLENTEITVAQSIAGLVSDNIQLYSDQPRIAGI
jgi:hypothetical protein